MPRTISLQTFNNRDTWITFPGKGAATVHTRRFDAMGKTVPGSKGLHRTTEAAVYQAIVEAREDSGQPNPSEHNAYATERFLSSCGLI